MQAVFTALSLATLWPLLLCAEEKTKHTNIVFILVDDLGWSDIGCYGSTFYETPNVDRLASEGVRFTDAYAAGSICSPTRSSIMTGKYPARTGNTDYFGGPQPGTRYKRNTFLIPAAYKYGMDLEEQTIAETMRSCGYATFFAGKWHLGKSALYPEHQGFDINKGGHRSGGPYGGKKYFSLYGNPRLEDGPPGEYLTDRLASETTQFIESHKDKAFFAYLSFYTVHTPLIPRDDLKQKYLAKKAPKDKYGRIGGRQLRLVQNKPSFAAMVEAMDQAVGKVLDKLEELGLDKNTAVFFMSDNGGVSTGGPTCTSNLPLKAGKGWLYEGGIREPMIIKAPGITQAGTECSAPVTSTDFYPTILELAGVPAVPQQHVDGVSLVPLLKSDVLDREAIYWHYPHYSGGLGGRPSSAVRSGDWKLIEFFEDNRVELYNLRDDLGEQNDLAQANPEKAKALREMLHAWQKQIDAKFPTPNPNYNPNLNFRNKSK